MTSHWVGPGSGERERTRGRGAKVEARGFVELGSGEAASAIVGPYQHPSEAGAHTMIDSSREVRGLTNGTPADAIGSATPNGPTYRAPRASRDVLHATHGP